MKIKILKEDLKNKLVVVNKLIPFKANFPILNNVLIKAENNEIELLATDLEIFYQTKLKGEILEKGKVVVSAKTLTDLANRFDEELIQFKLENQSLILETEEVFVNIPVADPEEFPVVPSFNKDKFLKINTSVLLEGLNQIIRCLSTQEIKPELNGVYFWIDESDNLNLVATDTFRLAEKQITQEFYQTNYSETKFILPKKFINLLTGLKNYPEEINFYIQENQITVELNEQNLVTQVLNVEYPNYREIIPLENEIEILVPKQKLINQLNLVKLFASKLKEIKINFEPKEEKLTFLASNELIGESKASVVVNYLNEIQKTFEISFNVDFIIEGIESINDQEIYLGFNSYQSNKPLMIKSPNQKDFFYILMPLNL